MDFQSEQVKKSSSDKYIPASNPGSRLFQLKPPTRISRSQTLMTSWTSTVWLSFLHDGSWRYQLFFWHWQVAGVIRLATRQSRRCKNHQLKLKLAKPQIRRRKASRSMLFIIIFKFGYSNYTTRRCFYQNRWLFFLYLSLTVN